MVWNMLRASPMPPNRKDTFCRGEELSVASNKESGASWPMTKYSAVLTLFLCQLTSRRIL
jgi:hypothetical protein